MRKMKQTALATTLLLFGCVPDFDTGNQGISLLGVVNLPETDCDFEGEAPPVISDSLVLDLAVSETLRIPVAMRNDWHDTLSLKQMDLRWECDSLGFGAGLSPLFVPSFDAASPFCLDSRSTTGDFVGFDVIALTGAPILQGENGVGWAEIIPAQLGQALIQTIDLGVLADVCVQEQRTSNCPEFVDLYQQAGGGSNVDDLIVRQYASYAFMDGRHRLSDQSMPPQLSSGYKMQLRALSRAEDSEHDSVFSNEMIQLVEICRNCGNLIQSDPPSRAPRDGFDCYYDQDQPR